MSPAAARPSSRYRSIVVAALLAAILLGLFALGRLSVDLPPARALPRLTLQVSAPGLPVPVIEKILTQPLENLLAGTPGVSGMESVTVAGGVGIDLHLRHRRDIDQAQREVMSRLEQARASWPASIDPPTSSLVDASARVVQFHVTSQAHDPLALRDWVESEFAMRLRELSGVAAVEIEGGMVREIVVMPDQRRLAGFGLSFDDLLQAIRKKPETVSRIRESSGKRRPRRELMQSGDLAAVAAVPVLLPDGESIHLAEVARLTYGHETHQGPLGREPVGVAVNRQPQADLADVTERIRAQVDWMRANRLVPDGIEIHSLPGAFDEARRSLKRMAYAFVAGFILILLTAYLIWGARRALILGVIILTSLQAVFVALASTGAALDSVTLGALLLGTGVFGAAAVLLFEAARGPAGPAAARTAVAAAGLALAAALAPVWFYGGELTVLYREGVLAFCGAWLLAALLALWLVPMFDARRPRRGNRPGNAMVHRFLAQARLSYDRLLRRLLRRAPMALAVAGIILVALTAVLFDKAPKLFAKEGPPGREIVLRLLGSDNPVATSLADDVVRRLNALPGLRPARHSAQASREQLLLRLHEERAQELGVDIVSAGRALAIALTGIPVGSFRDADRRYDMRLRLPPEEADSAAAGDILVLGELEDRPAVYLRDVATIERLVLPLEIRRHDRKPVIEITAMAANGSLSDQTMKQVSALLDEMKLPSGYQLLSAREMSVQGNPGFKALPLAVLLIFIGLAFLYRSLRLALLATAAAGATLIGTAAVLLWCDVAFVAPVWLGAFLLLGISAGHSAILAAHAATPPPAAASRRLRQAARRQFRPLLIVVVMAVLGMLFLTWINGGASVLPILITAITGLFFSLAVNLLLTPLLYWLFWRREQTLVP